MMALKSYAFLLGVLVSPALYCGAHSPTALALPSTEKNPKAEKRLVIPCTRISLAAPIKSQPLGTIHKRLAGQIGLEFPGCSGILHAKEARGDIDKVVASIDSLHRAKAIAREEYTVSGFRAVLLEYEGTRYIPGGKPQLPTRRYELLFGDNSRHCVVSVEWPAKEKAAFQEIMREMLLGIIWDRQATIANPWIDLGFLVPVGLVPVQDAYYPKFTIEGSPTTRVPSLTVVGAHGLRLDMLQDMAENAVYDKSGLSDVIIDESSMIEAPSAAGWKTSAWRAEGSAVAGDERIRFIHFSFLADGPRSVQHTASRRLYILGIYPSTERDQWSKAFESFFRSWSPPCP